MSFIFILYGILGGYLFWKVFENTEIFKDVYSSKIRGAGILLLPVVLWNFLLKEFSWLLTLSVSVISLMGIYDDIKGLSGKIKLLITFIISVIIISTFGYGLPINLLNHEFYIPIFNEIFWLVFILGFTNAFNVIDGKDGVLLTTSIVSLLFIYVLTKEHFYLMLSAISIGLLFYNSPKAKIIMGDAGSYLLGFLISFAFLRLSYLPFESMLLVLFFPFADTNITLLRRLYSRKNLFERDEEHIHHKICDLLGDRLGLALIFILNVLSAILSGIYILSGNLFYVVLGYSLWIIVILWVYLHP